MSGFRPQEKDGQERRMQSPRPRKNRIGTLGQRTKKLLVQARNEKVGKVMAGVRNF